MTGQAGQAPGVVKVRLSGELADIEVVNEILSGYGDAGVEVIETSAPRLNRYEPGRRVYLTLRIGAPR